MEQLVVIERLRRIEQKKRLQVFRRRQTQQCLMAMLLLGCASLSQKSISVVWEKDRSSYLLPNKSVVLNGRSSVPSTSMAYESFG